MKVDAFAGLARAGLVRVNPAIFDSGQSFAIEVDGTFGACALAQHFCVEDGNREEYYESEKQPPRGEGVAMKREPGGDQRCDHQKKADISQAAMDFFEVSDPRLAG